MADQPAVNWDALNRPGTSASVGGPRGYRGSEALARHPWRCPACGSEQNGPLSEGCTECGSGAGAAKHVGIDPPAKRRSSGGLPSTHSGPWTDMPAPIALPKDLASAFFVWMQQATSPTLAQAFEAGWRAAQADRVTQPADDRRLDMGGTHAAAQEDPDVRQDPPSEPSGVEPEEATSPEEAAARLDGRRARSIVAALKFFRAQLLVEGPEELTTGEWMTLDEFDRYLKELETTWQALLRPQELQQEQEPQEPTLEPPSPPSEPSDGSSPPS